jgi:hypothetical protein
MRTIVAAFVVLLTAMLVACGSNNATIATTATSGVTVTITPTTATLQTGKTQQFTTTVTGTSNVSVTWKVNDVVGGNTTIGTVSASGLYTAPAAAPSPNTVNVTATSAADTTKSATASVTVNAPISVSPSSANVPATQTQQFTALVTFSTNTAVTWQVNDVAGGNSTVGTISDTGLYTAPNAVPNPRTVTVKAISKADATQTASATVTITAPPIVITPTNVTLAAGALQFFSATAGGNAISPIWSISCQSQVPGGCGVMGKDGTFIAPASPPPGGTVTINASVADGSAAPSNTTATIQFSNVALVGSYAFSLSSQVGSAFAIETGSIGFDGQGGVTGGLIDRSTSAGVPVGITGGSYTIGTDGRGSVTVNMGAATETWQLVVENHSQALIAVLDANKLAGSGTLDLQTIGTSLSSVNGNYALNLRGVNGGSSAGAAVTGFAEAGSLSFDGAGKVARGTIDANVNAAITANAAVAAGSYTAPAPFTGRGTLNFQTSLGTQTFIYYQIDASRLKVIETDGAHFASGDLVLQPSGPFTNASFNGRFAFILGGLRNGAIGGVFAMNGSGSITNRIVDGANQVAFDNQGGYAVTDAASGRTTVSWTLGGNAQQYALYPRNDGGFSMVEIDPLNSGGGLVQRQTLTTPSVISLVGSFAIDVSGNDASAGQEIGTGVIALTGSTTNIQGTIDVQNAIGTIAGGSFQAGAFTVDIASGRGVTTAVSSSQVLPNGQLILYLLDANHAMVLEVDGARVLSGVLTKQF